MGGYHLSLRQSVGWTRKDKIEGNRWALSALDPVKGRVLCGAFQASDGVDIPYRIWMAREPRAAILLLHGCCDYSGAYDDIAPKLAQHGFSCMAYDQRGFGATASRGNWSSQERMIDDAREAIDFFRARVRADTPLFIIGESMGGSVAVHTAATYPELNLSGVVLVAPGALASALRNTLYRWFTGVLRLFASGSEIVVERTDARELTAAAAIRLLADPMVMQAIRAELLAGVIAMGYAAVTAAHNVTVPVLTMVASADDLLRAECVRQLHDNLAGEKTWAAIGKGPHLLLHWRHGGVVLRHARRWIERLSPEQSEDEIAAENPPSAKAA